MDGAGATKLPRAVVPCCTKGSPSQRLLAVISVFCFVGFLFVCFSFLENVQLVPADHLYKQSAWSFGGPAGAFFA